MADMTLCVADTCPVSKRCRRHRNCPERFPPTQSVSWFEPEKGEDCEGFEPVGVPAK